MRLLSLLALFGLAIGVPARADESKDRDFFEARIRPVLIEHCYRCHSEDAKAKGKLKADLLVDSKAGIMKGGVSGSSMVVGKPGESLLFKAMTHVGDVQMPPSGKLSAKVLDDFESWIKRGGFDPRDGKKEAANAIDWVKAKSFWAFQPPTDHPVPKVRNAAWPKREIDHFLLAELEKRNLAPVAFAAKSELIRRATFDLLGLPPTPEETDAFHKDASPDAFEKVVERLLASPHYGERWGRYWLDVARYAEDKALAFVNVRPHAFRYRDWVVDAFNRDMPYDRFLRLQLAGDLMDDPKTDYATRLVGLGFQGLGQEYHRGSVPEQVMADELDDRIDTLSRGLLGLTVSCARCHDHKYDPIPTRDYYSLAAAYNGSTLTTAPLAPAKVVEGYAAWEKQAKDAEAKLNQWVKEKAKAARESNLAEAGRYLQSAWEIRQLKKLQIDRDPASVANREKLHPTLIGRAIASLGQEKFGKQHPAISAWLAVADKAAATIRPANGEIDIPKDLSEASAELTRQVRAELASKDGKSPSNLVKSLSANADSLFFISEKDARAFLDESTRKEFDERSARMEELRKAAPPAPPLAHVVSGGGTAMRINLRGNVQRKGDLAPPGFLTVLGDGATRPEKFSRLDLAEAVASAKNPLTARVLVNRVWHYHFGRGIVGTTSNFGQLGDRPTHPELLDRLTVRFVDKGWSLRWLHREIMLSAAYQLSSKADALALEKDPENHYLSRFAARRLDFEAWRDAWLAVSGRLDRTIGGQSVDLNAPTHVRRTLYSKISRLEANKLLILFDFPDANVTSDRRGATTVPQQQLFVLNSEFTIETAKAFAKRLEAAAARDEDRVSLAFRLAYGREASDQERTASLAFLRDSVPERAADRLGRWEQFAQAILAANEFMWVD